MQAARRSRRNWIIGGGVALLVVLVAAAALFLQGRAALQEAEAAAAAEVGDIVAAFVGDLAETATASGEVITRQEAIISASVPGIVTEVMVREGDFVQVGDTLVQLDTADLEAQVTAMEQNLTLQQANVAALQENASEADIVAAEAAVQSAQARLDALLAPPTPQDIASWEADIRAQEANVASANASLSGALTSVDASTVESARAQVASAEIAVNNARSANEANPNITTDTALADAQFNLTVAQAQLADLLAGPDSSSVGAASASVAAAEANLARTQANYEAFLAGPTAAQVAGAEAALAQAESSLANLMDGPTSESLTVAEAQLAQAELNLANARDTLADASISAPFDGIITAVNYVEGELAAGPVASLISSEFVVVLNVDEIDIGDIVQGQPAEITLETWPDTVIPSEVGEIAPTATVSGNGLVTYEVRLRLGETELPVRAGMTANAELTTANRDDVLLVPSGAVRADRQNDQYFVNIAGSDAAGTQTFTEVEVTIGLRDNEFTQITGGINEGDEVLIGELMVPEFEFGGPFGGGN